MVSRTTVETYTVRNRRQKYDETPRRKEPTRFSSASVKAAPAPRPEKPPTPFGDLSRAGITELCELARVIWPSQTRSGSEKRRAGVRMLFRHLATLPGDTWQASGFDDENAPPVSILGRQEVRYDRSNMASALRMTFAARIIQPSLSGFRANKFIDYAEPFRQVQKDPRLDEFFKTVDAQRHLTAPHRLRAKFDLACALTTQGIALEHLTPSALLHYSLENKRLGLTHGANNDHTRFAALGAW